MVVDGTPVYVVNEALVVVAGTLVDVVTEALEVVAGTFEELLALVELHE